MTPDSNSSSSTEPTPDLAPGVPVHVADEPAVPAAVSPATSATAADPKPAVAAPDFSSAVKPPDPEPLYRILGDCYGMKKGEQRSARSIYQHGVIPALLVSRKLAEPVAAAASTSDAEKA